MALVSPAARNVEENARRGIRALRDDLRKAIPDAAAAILLAGVVFVIEVTRLRAGVDAAAAEMPSMIKNGGVWAYTLSQSIGWAALSWSWLTVLLGLSLPIWTRQSRLRTREIAERLHKSTSLTLIALMVAHAVLLIWDKMGDTVVTVFVPWTTSYAPGLLPQTLGILSFYVAVMIGFSFYVRDKIGTRLWRQLHRYIIPAVYVLAVWHTFLYGSDVRTHNELWFALWMLQIPIVGAFLARIFFCMRPM